MSRRTPLALVLVALFGGGCGTMDNIQRPSRAPAGNPDAPVCRAYGGVRGDWSIMSQYQWDHTASYLDYVFIPLLAGADICFDIVGDTLTLPYTLTAEARRALSPGGSSSGAGPDPDPVAAPGP